MNLIDKNKTLQPPEGYILQGVRGEGAYLRVTYQHVEEIDPPWIPYKLVNIFLNDMGREVLRTMDDCREPAPEVIVRKPPVRRWFRFRNGFLIALQGFEEMVKCLRKS